MSQAIVVMGVTGSGKSTLGQALARTLGWTYIEGDSLHPPANIAKMAAGLALDDDDRIPFLDNVARAIAGRSGDLVISCSALKRAYRDRLRRADAKLLFLLPLVDRAVLQLRLQLRSNHFMPAALLDSQLAALELPAAGEPVIRIDGNAPVAEQVAAAVAALAHGQV